MEGIKIECIKNEYKNLKCGCPKCKSSKPIKIYLGCPYWHEDEKIREYRFNAVTKRAGELMLQGHIVFSPISHSHPINKFINQKDWEFWKKQDFPFLDWCDELRYLKLEGWEKSVGLKAEIERAKELNKNIFIEV